ncbi:hypothetical protein FRC12_024417 [Ceratobasidium sp. 428]|nr:hypothetical protein FRC12_024417 [Ceratobasidium sp. 428]
MARQRDAIGIFVEESGRRSPPTPEGVAYLHEYDIIHGNIKSVSPGIEVNEGYLAEPGTQKNVLISQDGVAQLIDFGNSRLRKYTLQFTEFSGSFGLSSRWAAPELFKDPRAEPSKEADVYALGMTFLETITGTVPFANKPEMQVIAEVVRRRQHPERPTNFQSLDEDNANLLWELMVQTWSYDASNRPDSANIRDRLKMNKPALDATRSSDLVWENLDNVVITLPPYPDYIYDSPGKGFTGRVGSYKFREPTQADSYVSLVNNWHKNAYRQLDVRYEVVSTGPDDQPMWEAIPTVMGETLPQFAGHGSSQSTAREDAAKQIANSGHCVGLHTTGLCERSLISAP